MKNNTKRTFTQVSLDMLIQIEGYSKINMKPIEIAKLLGVHRSTVGRILRNPEYLDFGKFNKGTKKKFSAKTAWDVTKRSRSWRGATPKLAKDPKLRKEIERLIKNEGYSPDLAVGRLRYEGWQTVTTKTVYNSIYRGDLDIKIIDLHEKWRRKPRKRRILHQNKRKLGKSIELRPDISSRKEFGHWEGDTVIYGKDSVFTTIERTSRKAIVRKLERHIAENVNAELAPLLSQMKTLTLDNGSEFASVAKIFPETYFAHPYTSCEKGSIENFNLQLRKQLPRGTKITKLTQNQITEIQERLNNRPRKILGYRTPNEVYYAYQTNLLCCI